MENINQLDNNVTIDNDNFMLATDDRMRWRIMVTEAV